MSAVIGERSRELTMVASTRNDYSLRTVITRFLQVLNAANTTLGVHLQGHVSPTEVRVREAKMTKAHPVLVPVNERHRYFELIDPILQW